MVTKVTKINGQLIFRYSSPKTKRNLIKPKILGSTLIILMGIFLLPQIAYFSSVTAEKLIELTNQERTTAGLNALTANQLLTKAAIEKSQAILESQTFKHNIGDEKFSNWIKQAGYDYSYAGENLAIDFVTSEGIMKAWKDSLLHKSNLLNPYFKEIGIATIEGNFHGQNTTVVVQIFGSPPKSSTPPQVINRYDNFNYLKTQLNPLATTMEFTPSNGLENLLIHSASDQSLLPASNNKLSLDNEYVNYKLNNFFEQLNYILPFYNFMIIFISITMVISLLYLYYFYFLQLNKIMNPPRSRAARYPQGRLLV